MKQLYITALGALMLCGCSHHTYVVKENDGRQDNKGGVVLGYPKSTPTSESPMIRKRMNLLTGEQAGVVPNATAFRMSGDYSDNVAVTLSPEGELIYFPAPTDITADSEPESLGDGWWLNNQGLGPNSVFTKYTFAEYAALPQAPSPQQIKLSILPGAKVTEFVELPMKIGETQGRTNEIKEYLKERF